MVRWLLLVVATLPLCAGRQAVGAPQGATPAGPGAAPARETLDPDDPLLQALRALQRDVDRLRAELQGDSPSQPPSGAGQTSDAASQHWAFRPIAPARPPDVRNADWVRDDLDRFLLAGLERVGIEPNPDADRYTLLRRVAFDLTGLPPTEQEIREFVSDSRAIDPALARVVDGYLASPRFGERWGRHWLDVVRYADSVGRNWNAPFTYAWRYRDYVIDAFNQDKPYDQFLTEQLAGDLLNSDDLAERREQLIATGFLALGAMDIIQPEGESLMMDRVDEQIDVTTRAILGLTVACARCHDHKYEPVRMRDYYALAGVFYSIDTRSGQRRGNYVADDDLILLPSPDGRKAAIPGIHSMADMTRAGWKEVLWTTDPNLAMAAVEGRAADCPIRLDGDALRRGPVPPRGDFDIAGLGGLRGIAPEASGRRELAAWITSPDNPLTARVMANRVWQHLFGRGIVDTVDNFGVSGGSPTHPELLDHLASRFQRTWSVKSLVRSIVLSRAYRLRSTGSEPQRQVDANNELYWRSNIRRLEVEAIRDSLLSVAGRLSTERPQGIQVAGRGGKGRWGETRSLLGIDAPYRTVYLPVLRSLLPVMYSTFDFPDPTQVQGQREVTTVAPQSLFLMNSDLAAETAAAAARHLLVAHEEDAERIQAGYLRLLGRPPEDDELQAARELLSGLTGSASDEYRWTVLMQALLISGEFRTLL